MAKKIVTPDGEIRDEESKQPFFKTPFNHDTNLESDRTGLLCEDPTKTQQHMEQEANINTIVKNFGVTGTLPNVPIPPNYGDFSEADDYQTMMNTIAAANASFYGLPADIRAAFRNDPATYTTYVNDALENNDLDALRRMGLELTQKAQEPPKLQPTGVAPPEPPKPLDGATATA